MQGGIDLGGLGKAEVEPVEHQRRGGRGSSDRESDQGFVGRSWEPARLEEGRQEGRQEAKREDVYGLLRLGMLTVEQIAAALDVSTDFVLNVQAGMRYTN